MHLLITFQRKPSWPCSKSTTLASTVCSAASSLSSSTRICKEKHETHWTTTGRKLSEKKIKMTEKKIKIKSKSLPPLHYNLTLLAPPMFV